MLLQVMPFSIATLQSHAIELSLTILPSFVIFSAFQLHPDSDFQASRQRVSNGAREKRFSKTRRGTGINQIHSQDFLYYLTLRHSRHPAGR